MVENIAEAMSCKAAMRMAFRFIQMGPHPEHGLQEQTLKVKKKWPGPAEGWGLHCQEQLEGNRRRINQLEAENISFRKRLRAAVPDPGHPSPIQVREALPIARDEQKSIIHLPQILAKAEEDHPVRAGSGDVPPSHQGHAQAATLQSSDRQALQVHQVPNTVRRCCHRLPPIAQAIPLDLVQAASAETKLPAPKTQTSRDSHLGRWRGRREPSWSWRDGSHCGR
ncbi:hypothetical protein DPEC_G00362090 [Dallia pectoralis]|nr:hypothetical protein DPEC_G00362090 [Dallia pectoralis]